MNPISANKILSWDKFHWKCLLCTQAEMACTIWAIAKAKSGLPYQTQYITQYGLTKALRSRY